MYWAGKHLVGIPVSPGNLAPGLVEIRKRGTLVPAQVASRTVSDEGSSPFLITHNLRHDHPIGETSVDVVADRTDHCLGS